MNCSFQGCDRRRVARGLCGTHWRQQRAGKPLTPIAPLRTRRTASAGQVDMGCGAGVRRWKRRIREAPMSDSREGASAHEYPPCTGGCCQGCVPFAATPLRIADKFQSLQHRSMAIGSSRFKGVSWRGDSKRRKRWRAEIWANGVKYSLGTFATENEAARAYDAGARLHHGEFAVLNFQEEA